MSVLPAADGDCLILSYGEPRRHVLIDGGRGGTYPLLKRRMEVMVRAGEVLELMVVTHFDEDHIGGILKYVGDKQRAMAPRSVWFNGFRQLSSLQSMNARQADELSTALSVLGWPINEVFEDGAASLGIDEAPATRMLPGGLALTLLSPDRPRLLRLRQEWERWRRSATMDEPDDGSDLQSMGGRRKRALPGRIDVPELAASETEMDATVPNGSSIALLAEYAGRRVILAADAHPDLLETSIEKLIPAGLDRLRVDLMKVSHHGSSRNTTRGLLERLDCDRFIISTNGSRHDHPEPPAIARIIGTEAARDRTLYFNYGQQWADIWNDVELMKRHRYRCLYPADAEGLCIAV